MAAAATEAVATEAVAVAEEDKSENDLAVKRGDLRIFSAYETDIENVGKIWIITEADRSATTILLPSDY